MVNRTTLVLLVSAVLLVAIGMRSGIEIALAWATLVAAMCIELAAWKRGVNRVRTAVVARRARRRPL
jgi:hypothetical protein